LRPAFTRAPTEPSAAGEPVDQSQRRAKFTVDVDPEMGDCLVAALMQIGRRQVPSPALNELARCTFSISDEAVEIRFAV